MPDIFFLIIGCAIVTYFTRIAGHLIIEQFGTIHHRVRAALAAVPTAVLTALVAPSVVSYGFVEGLAIGAAALIAMRYSIVISTIASLALLVALRTFVS